MYAIAQIIPIMSTNLFKDFRNEPKKSISLYEYRDENVFLKVG